MKQRFDYTNYDDGTSSIYDRKEDEYYFDSELNGIEELLNSLNDENEQLKSELCEKDIQLDFLKAENIHMSDLVNENEQLKKQNKELKQDNDIKFWKLQLIEQWNNTELISHELYLAIENGYEISDEFKKHLDGLKKKHEEHMKKAERLGI